MILVVLILLTI